MRHEEVQRPQLHQVVVERCAHQQQGTLADGIQQGLPSAQIDINCLISIFGTRNSGMSHELITKLCIACFYFDTKMVAFPIDYKFPMMINPQIQQY